MQGLDGGDCTGFWRGAGDLTEYFPELPVHASTQMTVTGYADGAELLEQQGRDAVSFRPRELSLGMRSSSIITKPQDWRSRCFVHGALCYCYSGQCHDVSSMIGGRSGNRGRCAQPCRLP